MKKKILWIALLLSVFGASVYALTVTQIVDNTIVYLKKLVFTDDGTNNGNQKIVIDGTNWSITMDGALNISQGALKDNTVTTNDLANGVITSSKLSNNSVDWSKIVDGSITSTDIANGAITSSKLSNNSVDWSKIVNGSITSADIANGAIINSKLANNSVDWSKIVDGSITSADIANGSITQEKLDPSISLWWWWTTSVFQLNGTNAYYNAWNVWIGTSTPSQKLEVNGAIKASDVIVPNQAYMYVCVKNWNITNMYVWTETTPPSTKFNCSGGTTYKMQGLKLNN